MQWKQYQLLKLERKTNGHDFKERNCNINDNENCYESEGKYFQVLTNSCSEFIMYCVRHCWRCNDFFF